MPSFKNERIERVELGRTYELWFWFLDLYVSIRALLYKVVINVHMSMRSLLYNGSKM